MDAARLLRISPATRSVFSASTTLRPRVLCSCASRRSLSASSAVLISTEHLPRVAQPSLWQSLIPKPFRRDPNAPIVPKSKEWNPATIFIVLGLLVGSQAIQLIVLRKELANFIRQADAKIALLREVIERVQRGEKIDVDGLLGTGNAEKEKEWEEVLKEIEHEDALWQSQKRWRQKGANSASAASEQQEPVKSERSEEPVASQQMHERKKPSFY